MKPTFATVWLDGCSGCHMSFLDIDERLLDLAGLVDVVYSPLVDAKTFPDAVDITLVEGAVSSEEDLEKIRHVRAHTRVLISLGDCAVNSNVPSMRNPFGAQSVLDRAYIENADLNQGTEFRVIPKLLPRVRPVHEVIKVDLFVPGCPPPPDAIFSVLTDLLEGREPAAASRFGA